MHLLKLLSETDLVGLIPSTMFGFHVLAETHRSIHHQKSSSDSPLHANTGMPEIKIRLAINVLVGNSRAGD